MRSRAINKQIWLNEYELNQLKVKSKKVGLSETEFIRFLITGFAPKEKPDERFYNAMNELSDISDGISQIAQNVSSNKNIDVPFLFNEAEKWREFRMMVKREFLEPERQK